MTDNARRCTEFVRAAKGLFASARRVAGLQQQLNLALSQLGNNLTAIYGADSVTNAEASESVIAPIIFEAHGTVLSGDLYHAADAFSRSWSDAERWLGEASRSLKSMASSNAPMPYEDAVQTFWEQRFDGLDAAASAYVRLVQALLPQSSVAACTLDRLLRSSQRVAEVYPTIYDSGAIATASLPALLNQRISAQYLRMFLATRLTEETLDFCIAVQALEASCADENPEETSCMAQAIAARYVAASAPTQINVSGESRNALMEAAHKNPVDIVPFVEVKDELVQSMQCDDVLRQFNASPFNSRLVHRLTQSPWSSSPLLGKRGTVVGIRRRSSATTPTAPTPVSATGTSSASSSSTKPSPSPDISSMDSSQFSDSPRIGRKLGRKISSALRHDSLVVAETDTNSSPGSAAPPSPTVMALFQLPPTPNTLPVVSSPSAAPRPKSRNPLTLSGPTMDDILHSSDLEQNFRQFLYEKGNDRPLEFRRCVIALVHKYFGNAPGLFDSPSDESNGGESSTGASDGGSSSSGGISNFKFEIAQIYEDYLVPRNDETPLGVSYEMRCQLYSAVYETDGVITDYACAVLLVQACNEVITFLRVTEHPLYILSERWRPLWKGRSSSISKTLCNPNDNGASSQNSTPRRVFAATVEDNRARSRSMTIGDGPIPEERQNEAQNKLLAGVTPKCVSPPQARIPRALSSSTSLLSFSPGTSVHRSSQSQLMVGQAGFDSGDETDSDSESQDFLHSIGELIRLLQTEFLPCLQGITTNVKKIVTPDDIPGHVGEVQTLVSIVKILSEIPYPPSLKIPKFDNVASIYAPNPELVQFMVNAHKSIWDVTAKVAGLIRVLSKAADAHKVEKARLSHYWKLYKQLLDTAAQYIPPPPPPG